MNCIVVDIIKERFGSDCISIPDITIAPVKYFVFPSVTLHILIETRKTLIKPAVIEIP